MIDDTVIPVLSYLGFILNLLKGCLLFWSRAHLLCICISTKMNINARRALQTVKTPMKNDKVRNFILFYWFFCSGFLFHPERAWIGLKFESFQICGFDRWGYLNIPLKMGVSICFLFLKSWIQSQGKNAEIIICW